MTTLQKEVEYANHIDIKCKPKLISKLTRNSVSVSNLVHTTSHHIEVNQGKVKGNREEGKVKEDGETKVRTSQSQAFPFL